jgi:hypothetical protein
MIDTLKLTKRLKAAHMPDEQAEALSEGLAESLKESYVTREFLDSRLETLEARFDAKLATLRNEIVMWLVGTVALGTFINHWWR